MPEPHWCPVDGCDYGDGEEKSLPAVRSHVNPISDGEHDWNELKHEVEQQSEDTDGGDGDAEEGEPDGEQDEASENEENEDSEEGNMPTDEEYQQQHQTEEDEDGDGGSDSGDSGGFSLPALDRKTVMLLVGVLAVLLLAYVLVNRDGSSTVDHAEPVEDGEDDSNAVSNEEVTLIE